MVNSDLSATLPTRHFPVVGSCRVEVGKTVAKQTCHRLDGTALSDPMLRGKFAEEVVGGLQSSEHPDLNDRWQHFCRAVHDAIWKHLPFPGARANKPWISTGTLFFLDQRRAARIAGDWPLELELRKQTKKAASQDRALWLEELVAKGDWDSVEEIEEGTPTTTRPSPKLSRGDRQHRTPSRHPSRTFGDSAMESSTRDLAP